MINEEVFYDTRMVPLTDRESFNNTILLLTMVKSKFYYIIGFSRPEEIITIGFDFDSKTEGNITRELSIDFKSSSDEILLSCDVLDSGDIQTAALSRGFQVSNGKVCYKDRIPKDKIFPSSVQVMNTSLLKARRNIQSLLQSDRAIK